MDGESSVLSQKRDDEPLLSPSVRANIEPKIQLDSLNKLQIFGYGVGHLLNDLCAACWFNYLLYFMKSVVFKKDPDSGFYAGIVLLSGQIADGMATPLVGAWSDKTNTRIGKRTPWYLLGFVMVVVCFVFIFQDCLFCKWFDSTSSGLRIFYYCFFPSAFNVGWAAMQVAHMSLVPSLTLSRKTRDQLNNLRNTFTYMANLFVLTLAFLVFWQLNNDFFQFQVLSLGSLTVGVIASIFFLATVNERKLTEECKRIQKQLKNKLHLSFDSNASVPNEKIDGFDELNSPVNKETSLVNMNATGRDSCDQPSNIEKWELSDDEDGKGVHFSQKNQEKPAAKISIGEEIINWRQWFYVPAFYIYGFVYMSVRILVNVQSSLIIFYLQNVLGIAKDTETLEDGLPIEFAIIPMIIYLSSSIASSNLKALFIKLGRKKSYAIGAVAALIGTGIMMILTPDTKNFMYPLAIIIGLGQSINLNTGISLIAEVVGDKGGSGAFVFGSYSLLDKFANGIILYAVMNIRDVSKPDNETYVRICTSIIPACAVLLTWFLIYIGNAADYDSGDVVIQEKKESVKAQDAENSQETNQA